jgi:sulfide:quinone oxidoreductase
MAHEVVSSAPDAPVADVTGRRYRVLVAGAGVAGLECMIALRTLAEERVELDVLAPEGEFTYRPLSVAEPFGAGDVFSVPLAELLSPIGARHHRDALAAVQAGERRVTTAAGDVLEYDALVVACGGRPVDPLPGALVFRGSADTDAVRGLLDELSSRQAHRLVFAVPSGTGWALPVYELALLAAAHVEARGHEGVELTLVTPETSPLALFGRAASNTVGELLEQRGITVTCGAHPVEYAHGELKATGGISLRADRVVTIPRLRGPRIAGLPSDSEGFLRTTHGGAVRGVRRVHAAGDAVSFPIKQGGIAAQQAVAVAETLAARAGAPVTPKPFRPVLRGLLLTGGVPRYMRTEATSGSGDTSMVSPEPLWWPPSKVAGRYLAPFLAELAGRELPPEGLPVAGAFRVEREIGAAEGKAGFPGY